MSPSARDSRRPVRMLFLMHSDWDLVWQRPQALATSLARRRGFRILVAYLPSFRRWKLTRNAAPIRRLALPQLPLARRFGFLRVANRALARLSLHAISVVWPPDVVLVPYPSLHAALPKRLRSVPIVYDCMDLAVGFHSGDRTRAELAAQERALVTEARLVFVSSRHLGRHIESIMADGRQPILVRNGFAADFPPETSPETGDDGVVRIGYFGMISHWFDQDAIRASLEAFPDLEVHLWGPSDVELLRHPRLIVHGGVSHASLPDVTRPMDALIMPFVVSELIEGVDPVKLYEYLSLGKPVITAHYAELEHFDGLVHFYRSGDELLTLVGRVAAHDPSLQPDSAAVTAFLRDATWEVRSSVMASAIESMLAEHAPPS